MDFSMLPLMYAQSQSAVPNSSAMSFLALRRWCSGLTLSSPQSFPSLHVLWAFVTGLGLLLLLAMTIQGLVATLKQLFDLGGNASLVRGSVRRVWRTKRLVSIAIAFTVLSSTASQAWIFSLVFSQESRKADLVLLTKSRGIGELAAEQGMFASLTPLRDVAGLADNLPLLIAAAMLVFRASFEPLEWRAPPSGKSRGASRRAPPGLVDSRLGMRGHLCALSNCVQACR